MIKSKWIKEIINYKNMFNPFSHYRAQQYESNSAKIFIEEHFEDLYIRIYGLIYGTFMERMRVIETLLETN